MGPRSTSSTTSGRGAPGSFRRRFVHFFDARWESVFRYLNRLTGDADLASDVGQEAFVRLLERGEMPDDPSAWVISVAHNLLRDRDRKRARQSRLLTAESGDRLVAAGDPPILPDEAAGGQERAAAVRSALESMTPKHRELLLLRAEGYRYREIAAITGIQPGSVGKTLVRALAALSDALKEAGLAPER